MDGSTLGGASGRRIEFTVDIRFIKTGELASNQLSKQIMVQDNQGGKSSSTFPLQVAPYARLRGGFDDMSCHVNGAYRIDKSNHRRQQQQQQSDTVRFFISTRTGKTNGDVSIAPGGNLYFSIPCFVGMSQLLLSSKRDMPVTIRQVGWHTGWRREASRIVGVFRVVPLADATQKDGF